MTRIDGEVTIAAPVERVFDMVADERNEPRYSPRIVRAEKISDGDARRSAAGSSPSRGAWAHAG